VTVAPTEYPVDTLPRKERRGFESVVEATKVCRVNTQRTEQRQRTRIVDDTVPGMVKGSVRYATNWNWAMIKMKRTNL
jgi:hypothetical protein